MCWPAPLCTLGPSPTCRRVAVACARARHQRRCSAQNPVLIPPARARLQVIREKGTHVSKGYGFVTFAHPVYATLAMQNMNHQASSAGTRGAAKRRVCARMHGRRPCALTRCRYCLAPTAASASRSLPHTSVCEARFSLLRPGKPCVYPATACGRPPPPKQHCAQLLPPALRICPRDPVHATNHSACSWACAARPPRQTCHPACNSLIRALLRAAVELEPARPGRGGGLGGVSRPPTPQHKPQRLSRPASPACTPTDHLSFRGSRAATSATTSPGSASQRGCALPLHVSRLPISTPGSDQAERNVRRLAASLRGRGIAFDEGLLTPTTLRAPLAQQGRHRQGASLAAVGTTCAESRGGYRG